jgi:hypothetical protein
MGHGALSFAPPAGKESRFMRLTLAIVAVCVGAAYASRAFAAESHQTSVIRLAAPADEVRLWISHHPDDLTAAAGAEVIAKKGDAEAKIRIDDSLGGHLGFVVRRQINGNRFTETMTKALWGPIDAYQTTITVDPSGRECVVTIEVSATIENLNRIKLAGGLRRRLRGVRNAFDQQFSIISQE